MKPVRYFKSIIQNQKGQSCIGEVDLWENQAGKDLSHGSFFPSIWSPENKEVCDSAIHLKLTDGRQFILADLQKRDGEGKGAYYNFQFQPE
jgi:hypothetical protein